MENIEAFLKASAKFGVATPTLFQTADLYDESNMSQVCQLTRRYLHKLNKLFFKLPSIHLTADSSCVMTVMSILVFCIIDCWVSA